MERQPLLSVIVPVYNTEKFLGKCLGSIANQTYKNIEIIVVNDGSAEKESDITKERMETDDRIRLIEHGQNRGLFQARITGMEAATGEYFAFVDGDDYISVDWFRMLVKKAEETDSDIVVGEWCFEYENRRKEFLNLEHFRFLDLDLNGSDGFNEFMRQRGLDFSWHTIWNKIYKKTLWDMCIGSFKEFSEAKGHMVMCEDLVFSCALWHSAKKVTNIHNANYIYQLHDTQATKISKKSEKSILKAIDDVSAAFDFFEKLLKDKNIYGTYKICFDEWKAKQANTLWNALKKNGGIKKFEHYIRNKLMYDGIFGDKKFKNDQMYKVRTTIEDCYNWIEQTKININSDETKYVSFDIFDTLIARPFVEPTDLFYLLNKHFNEIFEPASYIDFAQIRIAAEQQRRKELNASRNLGEEITLDEIYIQISEDYMFDREPLGQLMIKEIELEKRFCKARNIGKELYELALGCDKKVIMCSDMYLPKNVVEEILQTNGYGEYEKLYLSSEIKLTKWSKNLYKHIIKDLGTEKCNSIVHIGDDWQSDVVNARECRLKASQLAKSIDAFRNFNPAMYSGDHFTNIIGSNLNGGMNDLAFTFNKFHGFRNMLAAAANKIYDNPYLTYNKDTDFNANPNVIGYYPVGMYLYGLLVWLVENIENKNINTIHFAARDGYLLKKAYDYYRNRHEEKKLPDSNYLHISRKSCVLLDISKKEDFYSVINKLNIYSYSPKKLAEMFKNITEPGKYAELPEIIKKYRIKYESSFISRGEYECFMKIFAENLVSWDLVHEYQREMKKYFQGIIQKGDVFFDIGYGGRAEASLSHLLGFPVDSYYIHSNTEMLNDRQDRYMFQNRCFYDYKPSITGVMREHLFMEQGPSTVGHNIENGRVTPVFEEYKDDDYFTHLITDVIQNAALEFVRDFDETFDGYENCLHFRKNDAAMPLEYYLHYSKPPDRALFDNLVFEDDFGEGRKLNALEFWNSEAESHKLALKNNADENSEKTPAKKKSVAQPQLDYGDFLSGKPKWKKAAFMLLFDRKLFAANVAGKVLKR